MFITLVSWPKAQCQSFSEKYWVRRMSKINRYKFWWVQCTTAGPNSKATGWKLYTWSRPTVLYDPRSSFPTAYPPTANVLLDSKLFPHSCRPCWVGMLRFLMLILTTFSPLGAAPGWYKVDAYVKYKISGGGGGPQPSLEPIYWLRIHFLSITISQKYFAWADSKLPCQVPVS